MNDTLDNTTGVTRYCLVCNTKYISKSKRSKFCSEACKQLNKRDKQKQDYTKVALPPLEEECPSSNKIDMEYWNYRASKGLETTLDDNNYERKCMDCNKNFKTRLDLMRYCSLKCHPQFNA